MDTITKLNKLNKYTDYLTRKFTHEQFQEVLLRDEAELKEGLLEAEEDVTSCPLNEYLSWETDGDHESNDEGGSYFSVHSVTFHYPDGVSCTFNWENGEALVDIASSDDDWSGVIKVSEIVEPFPVTIGE